MTSPRNYQLAAHEPLKGKEFSEDKYILRKEFSKEWCNKNEAEELWSLILDISTNKTPESPESPESPHPFLSALTKLLSNSSESFLDLDEGSKNNQYVLTGLPSAGKTTELLRIARKLISEVEKNDSNFIIHYCSMQNTNTGSVESSEELWEQMMRSHSSQVFSTLRPSLDDFVNLHREKNLCPILLIDTLDLIMFGIGYEDEDSSGHLNKLMSIARSKGLTILWSCRELEWKLLKQKISEKEIFPLRIPLPPLDEIDLRARSTIVSDKENIDFKSFFIALQLTFPIFAGYNLRQRLPHNTTNNLRDVFVRIRDDTSIEFSTQEMGAGPLKWIVKLMEQHIATDFLYTETSSSICRSVARRYDLALEDVSEVWNQIEMEFLYSALPKRVTTGSRIRVPIHSIPEHDLVEPLLRQAVRKGLVNRFQDDSIELAHQLFAEYCVWKHGKEKPEFISEIKKLPSCLLRLIGSKYDSELRSKDRWLHEQIIAEGNKWYRPFLYSNIRLAKMNEDEIEIPKEWKNAITKAREFQSSWGEASRVTRVQDRPKQELWRENGDVNPRYINNEKLEVLDKTKYDHRPLIVSGPPGVGKSHLSYVFIDKKGYEYLDLNWQLLVDDGERTTVPSRQQLPQAHFITLSEKLSHEIETRVADYYDSVIQPIKFRSWSIFEIFSELGEILSEDLRITLTYSDFCNIIQGDRSRSLRGQHSVQSLWTEFQEKIIDNSGKRKKKEAYVHETRDILLKERKAEIFWDFIQKYMRDDMTLAEVAGKAIDRVVKIISEGTREEKEALSIIESDILVLDEIQDLSAPVILLMLILHRGKIGSVMLTGDQEQTLAFTEFEWKRVFASLGAKFFQLNKEYGYERIGRWTAPNLNIKDIADNYREDLIQVERNVPPIVDIIRESWNHFDGGGLIEKKPLEKFGTSAIQPGSISHALQKQLEEKEEPYGVKIVKGLTIMKASWIARKIFDGTKDIALMVFDEKQQEKLEEELQRQTPPINIPVWTPESIKGLEYPIGIVIEPWSMSQESLSESISSSQEFNNWEEFRDWSKTISAKDAPRNYSTEIKSIKETLEQRKRFANVNLSRSQFILYIGIHSFPPGHPLEVKKQFNEVEKQLKSGDSDGVIRIPIPNIEIDDGVKSIQVLEFELDEDSSDTKIRGEYALFKRLSTIILASKNTGNRIQISRQAGHIIHILPEPHSKLPVLILATMKGEERKNLLDNYLKIPSEITGDSIWKRFDDKFKGLASKCFGIKDIKEKKDKEIKEKKDKNQSIPLFEYFEFLDEWDENLVTLANITSSTWEYVIGENVVDKRDKEFVNNTIREYVVDEYLGGYKQYFLPQNKYKRWIRSLDKLDFENYYLKVYIDEDEVISTIYQIRDIRAISKGAPKRIPSEDDIKDYWKEGLRYLNKGMLSTNNIYSAIDIIHKHLNKHQSNSLEMLEFHYHSIIKSINKYPRHEELTTKRVEEYCKYFRVLNQQKIANEPKVLFKLEDQIDEKAKEQLLDGIINHFGSKPGILVKQIFNENPLGLGSLLISKISREKCPKDLMENYAKKVINIAGLLFGSEYNGDNGTFNRKYHMKRIGHHIDVSIDNIGFTRDAPIPIKTLFEGDFGRMIATQLSDRTVERLIHHNLDSIFNGEPLELKLIDKFLQSICDNELQSWFRRFTSPTFAKLICNIPGTIADGDRLLEIRFGFGKSEWAWLSRISQFLRKLENVPQLEEIVDTWDSTLQEKREDETNIFEKITPRESNSAIKKRVIGHINENISNRMWRNRALSARLGPVPHERQPELVPGLNVEQSLHLIIWLHDEHLGGTTRNFGKIQDEYSSQETVTIFKKLLLDRRPTAKKKKKVEETGEVWLEHIKDHYNPRNLLYELGSFILSDGGTRVKWGTIKKEESDIFFPEFVRRVGERIPLSVKLHSKYEKLILRYIIEISGRADIEESKLNLNKTENLDDYFIRLPMSVTDNAIKNLEKRLKNIPSSFDENL